MGRTLALVFGIALLVRLAVLRESADAAFSSVLLGDARVFHAWSLEIAGGDWLGRDVFYQAPLYPYFLGVIHALGGDIVVVRLVQSILAAVACALVADATWRLFDRRTALVAGLAAALYAPSIWLEGMIQKTALATVLTALVLNVLVRALADAPEEAEEDELIYRANRRRHLRRVFALGAAIGLLALARENAIVLLAPVAAWCLASSARPRAASIAVLLGGAMLVLVPVGARNAAIGGAFLPTASNAGVNFYLGNGAGADGLYRPLVAGRGHALYEREDAERLAERDTGRELSAAGVSSYWFGRALDDVRADPRAWARLLASKLQLTLHRTEVMDTESFESHVEASRTLHLLSFVMHFGCLLPLAVYGIGLATRERRWSWPVPLAAASIAFSIALFFVAARFRAGVVPFLFPFAARGAIELIAGLRSRWRRRGTLVLLLPTALAALLANRPLDSWPLALWSLPLEGDPLATTESNLSSEFLRLGDPSAAYEHAARALEREPNASDALYNLGSSARLLERFDEAEAAYREAMRIEPTYAADCWVGIGAVRATNGDLPGALECFDRAVTADPLNAQAHYNRGLALRQSYRLDEAAAEYMEAIRLTPDYVEAHNNLGFLREREGKFDEAASHYRNALAIDPTFESARAGLQRVDTESHQSPPIQPRGSSTSNGSD